MSGRFYLYFILAATALSLTSSASATNCTLTTAPEICVNEVDAASQNGRPVTVGYVFKDNAITTGQFPQPSILGQSITSWQADCKTSYASGSPKHCIISFVQPTMASGAGYKVTFASNANRCSSCTGSTPAGYLTATQMANFDVGSGAGNWGGQIVVTPRDADGTGHAAVTKSAKSMLALNDPGTSTFGDCLNDYWLQGPVVTGVVVQDCTSASASDFGWTWNGVTMASAVTGNSATASLHPMFILYFYPSTSAVQIEFILEDDWTGRQQDQLVDVAFTTGSTPSTRWSHTGSRVVSGITVTSGSANITAAGATFQSTDEGLPIAIAVNGASNNNCGTHPEECYWLTLKTVTDSTHAVLYYPWPGSSASSRSAIFNLTYSNTRKKKTFWNGTAPGHIRVDYNFPYLISTGALPNYDTALTYNPTLDYVTSGVCCQTSYALWQSFDKGELGGISIWFDANDFSSNDEGKPIQREDLLYLYNMSTTGTAGGNAAKAWQQITGEASAHDSLGCTLKVNGVATNCEDAGGLGSTTFTGNLPMHLRESRTTGSGSNKYYCTGFENKNAAGTGAACTDPGDGNVPDPTGPNVATGRPLSRHSFPDDSPGFSTSSVSPVGQARGTGGWTALYCDHWLNYNYVPYILSGDYYQLEEQYFAASFCINVRNPGANWPYADRYYGYMNLYADEPRYFAWGLQEVARAADISPTGSAEKSYYTAILNSNLGVIEGTRGITGTPLTPTSTHSNCDTGGGSYNPNTANRWDFGLCTTVSGCSAIGACTAVPLGLHYPLSGIDLQRTGCASGNTDFLTFMNVSGTSAGQQNWMLDYLNIVLGYVVRPLGFSNAQYINSDLMKMPLEQMGETSALGGSGIGNPYLYASTASPENKPTTASCTDGGGNSVVNVAGTLADWDTVYNAFTGTLQAASNFRGLPLFTSACGSHSHPIMVRSVVGAAKSYGLTASDAKCASGICRATTVYDWLAVTAGGKVPYPGNSEYTAAGCGTSDQVVPFALAPFSTATVTSCTLSPSSASISIGGTQAATASCNYSDGSGPTSCTSDLSLGTSNAGIASVSSQTVTGVAAGSATITGTTISNSTVCTPTMAATVTAIPDMKFLGITAKGGVVIK